MITAPRATPTRSRKPARVVRVDSRFAFVSFASWCAGAALARIPLDDLTQATGLGGADLPGAALTAQITLAVLLEEDLHPEDWQLVRPAASS